VTERHRPESLEGRWDILYRDYPEIYEEWGRIPKHPDLMDVIAEQFPLAGLVVADVGSGTGISTFKLARHAERVIGIEPEEAMRSLATRLAAEQGFGNLAFVPGDAEHLPFTAASIDAVVAITLAGGDVAKVAAECERVAASGGVVLRADVAPGWYGGELNPIITGQPRDENPKPGSRDAVLSGLGYEYLDVFMDQDYGTVDNVVRTYGFIHGKRVIDYVVEHRTTTIRWKMRVRFKIVP
jgi:ubiquinone/menaquinone biosynthesis C-methylase UbiE